MNRYITKRMYIVINVALFIIEIFLIYLLINRYLNNDFISPNDITFYEYLINKFQELV